MGALSWVTVSINAYNFVTDVISGKFCAGSQTLFFCCFRRLFYSCCAGIPVYGSIIIQNTTPETADADNSFVSLFKKCIINLAKHVQLVIDVLSCYFRSFTHCAVLLKGSRMES
jgi:hypothetical protein